MSRRDAVPDLPLFADLEEAARRLRGQAVFTPLLESGTLNERCGGRILLKAEMLQRTGSFKFRGAYNRIRLIPEAVRHKGVVAYSSGNHAQGVAAAAAALGVPASVVMPADAPAVKLANTRALGASIITYQRYRELREEVAAAIVAESGATLVPPYDDRQVIAGQGTVGLEIIDQAAALGLRPDAVLAPCGGGGLSSGVACAVKELSPDTAIYAVEPEAVDDTTRSLAAGRRLSNGAAARSICDGLLAARPGHLTFRLNKRLGTRGLTVSDDSVRDAMLFCLRHLKLLLEPSGAVGLAAVLAGAFRPEGRVVVVILSGGNLDDMFLTELLQGRAG